VFNKRDGGDEVNTPYVNPESAGCTLCGKCMEICPTEALTPTPREDIDMGVARIDRTACYPWVDRGVCGACVTICPLGAKAIGFDFANIYRPVVKQACVGCGLCVEVCPHPSLPIRVVARSKGSVATDEI
jgi:ferredoxin-type protein NapG